MRTFSRCSIFRQKLADGHVSGVQKFLGLKEHERKPPSTNGKIYIVQVGTFEDRKNAEAFSSRFIKTRV